MLMLTSTKSIMTRRFVGDMVLVGWSALVVPFSLPLMLMMMMTVMMIGDRASALTCNLCNNADLMEDCFINHKVCQPDYVCFVEIQYFTLTKNDYTTKTMKFYSMGCQHFHLCRDRRTHGPGAYGYGTQQYQCCCSDYCHEPDGVGLGRHDLCPALWKNRTLSSSGPSLHRVTGTTDRTLTLRLLTVIGVFLARSRLDTVRW